MPKILLSDNELPTHYYNILADLPFQLDPPLNPKTKEPVGPDDLSRIFPQELIKQEVSKERFIDIPEEVQAAYKIFRPSPLIRATRLEKELDTPAKIYYKYEGVSPSGSHKTNTAIAQAYYNKREGVKRLATETGAGQWGSALSFACNLFGLECMVYMVKVSFNQKPYRRIMIETYGGKVVSSPSSLTNFGRKVLAEQPDSPGSLGIAISEALEDTLSRSDTKYALGSVLNHVLLHQTVIGLEAKAQLEKLGDYPDVIIGCHGGGSNLAGISFPFLADKLNGSKPKLRVIASEPKSCPSLTKGEYRYDFGDTAGMTPLLKMKTLGADFVPPPIHAGGLRYHGAAPLTSALYEHGYIEAVAPDSDEAFEAAVKFARSQGIIPAPESAHAIKTAIDEAIKCRKEGKSKTILFNLSGHGHFDMQAYADYFSRKNRS
ncbi:TrpB-like pyridoxal phosphate-dependent enzyme [Patescibacteria group bacterium]|nr:TrpB-like pyridoxal phosphate-dependent enzyme [Patescibacteria group bacterium]